MTNTIPVFLATTQKFTVLDVERVMKKNVQPASIPMSWKMKSVFLATPKYQTAVDAQPQKKGIFNVVFVTKE